MTASVGTIAPSLRDNQAQPKPSIPMPQHAIQSAACAVAVAYQRQPQPPGQPQPQPPWPQPWGPPRQSSWSPQRPCPPCQSTGCTWAGLGPAVVCVISTWPAVEGTGVAALATPAPKPMAGNAIAPAIAAAPTNFFRFI